MGRPEPEPHTRHSRTLFSLSVSQTTHCQMPAEARSTGAGSSRMELHGEKEKALVSPPGVMTGVWGAFEFCQRQETGEKTGRFQRPVTPLPWS